MTIDAIVLSRKGFSLVYLNLRLGLAFVYGCHGDDVQATVTVDPVNVGAVFIMRGCDDGSDDTACYNSHRVDSPLDGQ